MNYLKNNRGSALVLTIVLLMIVSILGIAMLYSITSEIKINRSIEERAIAKYLAQAGIDHALYLIVNDDGTMEYPYKQEVVMEVETRMYKMTISKDEEILTIRSIGKLKENGALKKQVSLEATVDEDGKITVKTD